ncbi:MAG: ferredoxin [Umezawaea sp.]
MKVFVDEDKCCGAGSCVLSAPEVFDQRDDDGVVVLLDAEPAEHLHAAVREAVQVCPAAAISLA